MTSDPNRPLTEQIAVVTGAARGIGRAIAEQLAAMGAQVVLTARSMPGLEAVQRAISDAGGKALAQPCDLRDPASIDKLAARVQELGRCDILVNCAGTGHIGQPLHEMEIEAFDEVLETNLRGPFLTIRAFAPMMIAAGGGQIVNISSLAGKNPLAGGAAYAASKWGLNGLTASVAEELRSHRIRVSTVAPGSVNTAFDGGSEANDERAKRKLQPEDVAGVVAMLVLQPPQSFISEVQMRPTVKP